MSLWKFSNRNKYGNIRTRIVHSETSQLSLNPKGFGKFICAQRFSYEVEESLIPPRLFETEGKKYIVPSWKEVHPKTTMDDVKVIIVEKEIKVDPNIYTVTSGSGDYHVRHNPATNKYTCDCMGFWRVLDKEKGCKHIIQIRNENS